MEVLKKTRANTDVTMSVSIVDNGIAIHTDNLTEVFAGIYSEKRKVMIGRCEYTPAGDKLILKSAAANQRFEGPCRLVISCTMNERKATYDAMAYEVVRWSADVLPPQDLEEASEPIGIHIEFSEISSSFVHEVLAAAIAATDAALNAAANTDEAVQAASAAAIEASTQANAAEQGAVRANVAAGLAEQNAGKADDAAERTGEATENAEKATAAATTAAARANDAADRAEAGASAANNAAASVNEAKDAATTAAGRAETAATSAEAAAAKANTATEGANAAASVATEAAAGVDKKIESSLAEVDTKLTELSEEIGGNYTEGYYLKANDTMTEDGACGVTDYIPYTPGADVLWRFASQGRQYYILFYRADKSFINGSDWVAKYDSTHQGRLLTAGEIKAYAPDAAYIRASFDLEYESAMVYVGSKVAWPQPKRTQGVLSAIEELQEFKENETTYGETEHGFIFGIYTSQGVFSKSYARISARIPLSYGQKNSIGIIMPQNFALLAMSIENKDGIVRDVNTAYEFVGSEDYSALWVALRREDNLLISEYEMDSCKVTNKALSSNSVNAEEIKKDVESISKKIAQNERDVLFNSHNDKTTEIELREQISMLEESMSALYKAGTPKDSQVITLPHANGGLFILNMHKRENDGYVLKNNAYLPNANNDFSDVCVFANNEALSMRRIYSGNIDIVPDDRLVPARGLIYTDSKGVKYGANGPLGKVFSSADTKEWQEMSVFKGLDSPSLSLVDSQDNIYVYSQGKLYKSVAPYTSKKEVLNVSQYHSDALILPECLIEHPTTHRLFVSTYQEDYDIHILYSDNYGESWTTCYRSDKYQHVHNISIDSQTGAIYVGCDGGGGILKSTDNGNSWIDLREQNPDIPQSTDCGAIYSDESGYRLFGGETTIVGGHSIIKSYNDADFIPVLSCGKGLYYVMKLNGVLFGGVISTEEFQSTGIVLSEDNGETWKTAMTTSPMLEKGASDGYRYMSKVDEQIICSLQSTKMNLAPLRIFSGGNNYYAQYLVEVPRGVESLVVESGHLASKQRTISNRYGDASDADLFRLNFINGVSSPYAEGTEGGRNIGEIIPPIQSAKDKSAVTLKVGHYHDVENVDLSNRAFHIGFWYKTNNEKLPSESWLPSLGLLVAKQIDGRDYLNSGIYLYNNYFLKIGNETYSVVYPGTWGGAWLRFDINFTTDGKFVCYVNGRKQTEQIMSDNIIPYLTKGNVICLYNPQTPTTNYDIPNKDVRGIQYFEITDGNISEEDAMRNYYCNLYDVY